MASVYVSASTLPRLRLVLLLVSQVLNGSTIMDRKYHIPRVLEIIRTLSS